MSLDREPGQKRRLFSGPHPGRVRLSVEHDVTANPVDVRFLRPRAIVANTNGLGVLQVAVRRARRLLNGTVAVDPGVQIRRGHAVTIESDHPMCAHADGEAVPSAPRFDVRVHPAALRVRVPRRTRALD